MSWFKLIPTYSQQRIAFIYSRYCQTDRFFYPLSNGSREKLLNLKNKQSWFDGISRVSANALKERLKDPYMAFIRKSLMLLQFIFPLLRHAPVPKQGTKHLVTNALFLSRQLLVFPAIIWCDPAALATERDRSVSDPQFACVSHELALSQICIQV